MLNILIAEKRAIPLVTEIQTSEVLWLFISVLSKRVSYFPLVFAAVMAHFSISIITRSAYITVYYVVILSALEGSHNNCSFPSF